MTTIHEIKRPAPTFTGWAYGLGDIEFHYFTDVPMTAVQRNGGQTASDRPTPLCGSARRRSALNYQNAYETAYRCRACLFKLDPRDPALH